RWTAFIQNYPAEVPQQINRGLANLGRMSTKPGHQLLHSRPLHLSLFTGDPEVAQYLLDEMTSMGLVEPITGQNGKTGVRIKTKGWERIKVNEGGDTPSNLNLPNGPWSIKWTIVSQLEGGGQGHTFI